ncbi:unnamed protein product [Rotaria sp. Silwood1]|nr:unnamed protein product [Rotaria sp. Silwood1]CAF1308703.1 unnamed protein product [Rotaria sp. Silwood1]CAF3467250.1 unnamed protein product [Rotaria sp. Silwood1]CAF4557115.1 unnamed protein product [Rotaria sp. Silwood1]
MILKKKLIHSESRIVILWVQSNYIPLILEDALKFDLVGPEFIWILSSSISLDSFNKKYHENLIGLLTIEPVATITLNAPLNTALLNAAYDIWQKYESESFPGSSKLNLNNLTDRITEVYYYVQNLQSFSNGLHFVSVLEYSNTSYWYLYKQTTVIFWPGNSLITPTDRAILKDINLRIGVIESVPFTIITKFMDEFGQNTTKLTVPPNQTYSEVIQAVANGDYAIVIGDVIVTATRRESVDFSNAIFDNSLRIITRRTFDVNIDLLSFLKPFSCQLWLLVFDVCIYAAFLLCLIERQDNETLQNRSILSQFLMSVWYSFGNIVGYGVDFNANTAAERLLTAGLYMLSLMLLATYTANLASNLTISKSKDIISGIDDVKNGKISFNRIDIRVDTTIEEYYLRKISFGSRNYYPLKSRQELYDSLLAGSIDVSFMDASIAEYITNNIYCNLTLIGKDFHKGDYGIVTEKQCLYAKDLDVNILSLRESGQLDELRRKWFQKNNCRGSFETSTVIKIESMGGLFLIFGLITILSFLLFLWSKRSTFKNYFSNLLYRKKSSGKKKTQ